jgi:hypothetical protein
MSAVAQPTVKRGGKGRQLHVLGDERCIVGEQTSVMRGKGGRGKAVGGQG